MNIKLSVVAVMASILGIGCVYAQDVNKIDATSAGGKKQTTIIDENGNLKMVEKPKGDNQPPGYGPLPQQHTAPYDSSMQNQPNSGMNLPDGNMSNQPIDPNGSNQNSNITPGGPNISPAPNTGPNPAPNPPSPMPPQGPPTQATTISK